MQVHKRQGASSVATVGSLVPEKSGKDRTDRSFEPGERSGTEKAGKREVRGRGLFLRKRDCRPIHRQSGRLGIFRMCSGFHRKKTRFFTTGSVHLLRSANGCLSRFHPRLAAVSGESGMNERMETASGKQEAGSRKQQNRHLTSEFFVKIRFARSDKAGSL